MFQFDALVFHCFQNGNAHIARRKVVVCAVNRGFRVPHTVHSEIERNEYEVCDSYPENNGVKFGRENHGFEAGNYRRRKACEHQEQCAKHYHDDIRLVNFSAESVVDGPVPRRVGMAVEKHATFHFARAFFDCGNVCARFFGEKKIKCFSVKSELHNHYEKSEYDKRKAQNRQEEVRHETRKHTGNRYVNPSEETAGIFLKRFHVGTFAPAIVLKYVGHILAGYSFALFAGGTFGHIFADMSDFVNHIPRRCRFVFNQL